MNRSKKKASTLNTGHFAGLSGGRLPGSRGDSSRSPRFTGIGAGELAGLAIIVGTALFLRFGRWDLLEFKGDEATALQLALGCIQQGRLPTAGLMSSIGAANPPLFIYLLIPIVALSANLAIITSYIAASGTAAVVVCWHIGRKYYSPAVGLIAAAFFAVSPWAVIYSRKIWAQDFVPVFASLTLWALHALISGKNRRAIFWVVLLPLCLIQIHYSGFALTAAVGCILLLLRPKFDWRFATGGAVVAFIVLIPFLYEQTNNGWADFHQGARTLGNDARSNPNDLLIDPASGSSLSNHHYLTHALGIMNGGEIEELIGLSKWDFEKDLTLENWALWFQQLVFTSGVVYLLVLGAAGIRWSNTFPWVTVEQGEAQTAWMLVFWVVVPTLVYLGVWLKTALSYFVLFYPAPFLFCAVIGQELWIKAKASLFLKALLCGTLGFILAGNLSFILHLYAFVARNGGAHGNYGTILSYKQQAAIYLARNADVRRLQSEGRLLQMDRFGEGNPPQPDIPLLALLANISPQGPGFPSHAGMLIIDRNRASFTDDQWARLDAFPRQEFGPIEIYFSPPKAK
ncbi:MAG TPA: hypothetical protein VL981_00520 [Candidatus Methylacidiphilales bacterium]|nr:hypothetical protein [Candidatus Methylacidiphilales bacterium]